MHPQISPCATHTLIDATNLRCGTSTDKTMTLEEEDGVPRHRNWKAKGGARSKNVMQMQTRVAQWQLAVKSGSMHSHLPRNRFLSVLGHPMTKTTVLDSALELMKILDGCNLFYFCILLSCHAAFSIKSMSWEHFIFPCCICHSVNGRVGPEWYTWSPKRRIHSLSCADSVIACMPLTATKVGQALGMLLRPSKSCDREGDEAPA
jgi:hypothetical protein